ncbi:uncharacterized protein CDV56_105163 [Aspergillus thermomutatus]|uniref:Uncharacterized protein n=1 Tax=Aspergillus thermomutatus TaxID=41047 RepID=A0A397GEC4_ASPTH|nr:uncharacterized protein CDV56_105163 [Aspergillus thermomutatus]RHZ49301.1 hypothetical protein CDV56_105163 [Aspergillus thermomutatus]
MRPLFRWAYPMSVMSSRTRTLSATAAPILTGTSRVVKALQRMKGMMRAMVPRKEGLDALLCATLCMLRIFRSEEIIGICCLKTPALHKSDTIARRQDTGQDNQRSFSHYQTTTWLGDRAGEHLAQDTWLGNRSHGQLKAGLGSGIEMAVFLQ